MRRRAYHFGAVVAGESSVSEVGGEAASVLVAEDVFELAQVVESVLSLLFFLLPFIHIVSGSAVLESPEEGLSDGDSPCSPA